MTTVPAVRGRRKARQNVSAFAALIATPATGDFDMPAGGKILLLATAGAAAGDTAAVVSGPSTRTIKTPLLLAGESVVIDWIERASNVALSTGFEAYVDTGLGLYKKIAENP